jgi:hypothetical protein
LDITKWAEDLTEEVYNEWKTKYSFWKDGFEVFYSPVRYRPELMIISLNPGGGEKDFQALDFPKFQDGNFSLPPKNRYLITKYRFAKKVRTLFEGNEDVLKTSVVTTALLFRSQKIDYWKKHNPEKTRLPMERFAYTKVQEIVKKVEPKKILLIGIDAYNRLRKNIIKIENENIVEKTTIGRIITANAGCIDILIIPHLTGPHVSHKNMDKMKKAFVGFLNLTKNS